MPDYTPTEHAGAEVGAYLTPSSEHSGAEDAGVGPRFIQFCRPDSMTVGAQRNNTEGNAAAPSLELQLNGSYRFKWVVRAGARSVSVLVKYPTDVAPRPSLVIKANAGVGLASDVEEISAGGTGWVTIGPAAFTATADGVVYVELRNNTTYRAMPCYFDHIVTT